MTDIERLFSNVVRNLPRDQRKPALVSSLEIEWKQPLFSGNPTATLIVITQRVLALNGGDGRHGVDGQDMNNLQQAIQAALLINDDIFPVTEFIVKERKMDAMDAEIDALFD